MRKLLTWLCVLLLPLLGLGGGIWLTPDTKPLWEKQFEYCINVLGFVDEGKTLLAAESCLDGKQFFFRMDVETGKERFRYPLIWQNLQASEVRITEAVLSDDGQHVVFPARELDSLFKQLVVYDWKDRKVARWLRTPTRDEIAKVQLKHGILTAITSKQCLQWKNWKTDSNYTQTDYQNGSYLTVISHDSQMAISAVPLQSRNNTTTKSFTMLNITEFAGPKTHEKMLHDIIVTRLLDISTEGMTLVDMNINMFTVYPFYTLRKYQFDRNWNPVQVGSNVDLNMNGPFTVGDGLIVFLETDSYWRWKLNGWMGDKLSKALRLNTPRKMLSVHDRTSLKRILHLALPAESVHHRAGQWNVKSNVGQSGMALWSAHRIEYWQLNSFTRYFPILGLFLGSMLSLLLMARRYRRPRILSAATIVC